MSTTPTPTRQRAGRALAGIGILLAAAAAGTHASGASRQAIVLLILAWIALTVGCACTPPGDWTS